MQRHLSLYINRKGETETQNSFEEEAGARKHDRLSLQYVKSKPTFNTSPKFDTLVTSYYEVCIDDEVKDGSISELVLRYMSYDEESKKKVYYALDDYGGGRVVWWALNIGNCIHEFSPNKNQVWHVNLID